jgi:nitrogen regulatory protein PII-like uncharacterized protein
MSKQVAFILTDKDGEVTHSFLKPSDVDHFRFTLEDNNKTYRAMQDILHFGVRIGTIYQEEQNEIN